MENWIILHSPPKSERCELVKLCHINCSCAVFLRHTEETYGLGRTQRFNFEWTWATLSDSKIFNVTERHAASLRQLSFLLCHFRGQSRVPGGPAVLFTSVIFWWPIHISDVGLAFSFPFLSRVSILTRVLLTRDIDIANLSVRPSVRP